MPTTLYTDEDLEAMSREAEAVGDLLNAIDRYLENEKKGSKDTPSNVIYVDFKIKNEFTRIMSSHAQRSLMDILSKYHDWAERTFLLCLKNGGRLDKGLIREYVVEARDIVATITKILPMAPQ
jgi:hypothetical protein